MDLLTAIQNEPLNKIQDTVLTLDSMWLDYDALNRALVCKRKDVAKWLIKLPCKVNKVSAVNQSLLGNTPLHNAVKLGDMEIIEMLLKNEASIVAVDSDGNTALHFAFLYRYDKITDLLLGHLVKTSNYTNVKNNQGLSHLHIACTRNNIKAIQGFLKDETHVFDAVKSDSPSSWAGYTGLHFAIEFKSLEAAKILLAAGSKMTDDESNKAGQSPSQLLCQQRGELYIMSEHLDGNDFPYFHLACLKESAVMVKKFLESGADPNDASKWSFQLCNHYSPLQCAIESSIERKEKVQLLLNHGATVERGEYLSERKHMTALHLVLYKEYHTSELDGSIVDCLYTAVKDKDKNLVDGNGLSYFHIAVTRNNFYMVKIYLDKGADINQAVLQNDRGFSGFTALHFAVQYQLVDMAKFLIERGADVNAFGSSKSQTPLFQAFELGHTSLIELLFESGATLDKKSALEVSNNTLLHCAAQFGNHEMMQYFVDSGKYKVDAPDHLGQTPLIVSLKTDRPSKKLIVILLKAGASFFVEDNFGICALDVVDSSTWLNGDMERFTIYKMLLEQGQQFNRFYLLESGCKQDILLLLQTGIDLFAVDSSGNGLIHMLATNSQPGAIEQLRGRSFDVNARDSDGWTPLMYAGHNENVTGVEFLLNEGADVEAVEKDFKKTALFLAVEEREDMAIISALLKHGANAQIETPDAQTIFDLVPRPNEEGQFELILSHLALQEANGTAITQLIQSKIDARAGFKSFFQTCRQQLSFKIYRSITLFDVMTSSERKLERYLRNEEMASKLKVFRTKINYFETVLCDRLSKATAMVELRRTAAPIICGLMKTDYDRLPCIADEIVSYLEKQDLEHLIAI